MSHVLVTILISLALPAAALAVIARIERSRREPHDGMQHAAGEPIAAPEFEVSEQAKFVAEAAAEEPRYRERTG